MNLEAFYDAIRRDIDLTEENVKGFDEVLAYLENNEDNLHQAAYILATAYHETAHTMHPVAEAYWIKNAEAWRKKNLRYYPYYGRGYVQLTWKENYKRAADHFDVDFVSKPDLVMQPKYALPILVVGMNKGWFTGKGLDDYIDNVNDPDKAELKEYINARRIVNGTDKAAKIGDYALVFERGLKAGGYGVVVPIKKTDPVVVDDPGVEKPKMGLLALFLKLLTVLFKGA